MKFKYCPGCRTEKCTDEFYKNSHAKDGLQGWCKVCRRTFASDYPKEKTGKVVIQIIPIDLSLPMGFGAISEY